MHIDMQWGVKMNNYTKVEKSPFLKCDECGEELIIIVNDESDDKRCGNCGWLIDE